MLVCFLVYATKSGPVYTIHKQIVFGGEEILAVWGLVFYFIDVRDFLLVVGVWG